LEPIEKTGPLRDIGNAGFHRDAGEARKTLYIIKEVLDYGRFPTFNVNLN
jgi:hypothetical protein